MEELLTNNRIFRERLVNIGFLQYDRVLSCGFTGVMLRSCGYSWDIRKNEPYEIYNLLNFNSYIGSHSDCFDRYLIRIFEMYTSCDIILQALNLLTDGPVSYLNNKINMPRRLNMK